MKTFIRIYTLSSLLALPFMAEASGQSVGNSNSRFTSVTKTATVKKTVNNRVPSTKVIYKLQCEK